MSGSASLLILDAGSPVVSVALGRPGTVVGQTVLPLRRSAERLLGDLDSLLADAEVAIGELDAVIVLRGPGSFTGLRVGLATGLGLARASGIRAGALDTLDVLAAAAGRDCRAVVYAQRGEWLVADYRWDERPIRCGEARLEPAAVLASGGSPLIGHELERLPEALHSERLSAPPLAGTALAAWDVLVPAWGLEQLMEPVYFRPPAVTPAP